LKSVGHLNMSLRFFFSFATLNKSLSSIINTNETSWDPNEDVRNFDNVKSALYVKRKLFEMPTGKKIIYHNGWWHGNNTVFSRLPEDSTAIIVLGNKFNRSIYQAKKIAGIFKGYGIQSDDDE